MDLGTANTIITSDGKIVVDEPSVVALDRRTDKMIAVGEKAKLMYEKTHDNIRHGTAVLREGVIADFYACEQLMRGLDQDGAYGQPSRFSPFLAHGDRRSFRFYGSGAACRTGFGGTCRGRDVYLIYEPMRPLSA